MSYENLTITRTGPIFTITLARPPENRITSAFAQELIRAFHSIQRELGPDAPGAVITRGSDTKFWTTGLALDERDTNPFASTDGFYPLLHTILDFPHPTIALITGHVFGGACLLALAHDYRIMNSTRGFFCMPPVELGLHFDGIGALPGLKLAPQTTRKVLLEAHRFTGKEALEHGIVDAIAGPSMEDMVKRAEEEAEKWVGKSRMGVYGVVRGELWGAAAEQFQRVSFVHSKPTSRRAKAKI
jgi:Delta3-Delta2-enoyl-CoA isomerase